jgi:hypothetical protein
MARKTRKTRGAPAPTRYEVSDRVARQAAVRPYQRDPRGPLVRPLRIYTLDPSVSDRLGGVATVAVPYETLAPGPVGSLFDVKWEGAPSPLEVEALDLDHPHILLSSGLSPTPSDGRFHLQMVYAVCSLTYAAFRRALGRDIGWATEPAADGVGRLVVRPFGFRGRNAGYSREAGDLSFGYFRAGREPAGFTVQQGLICTALSHDIVAHETTHALLDGLRSSFLSPTNVDVPAFHEGFSDLVALFLHFTYPDVVEQAMRGSGGSLARMSLLTDLAREFGYARPRHGEAAALRSGVDVEGVAAFDSDVLPSGGKGPTLYDPAMEPHALGSVLVSAVFEAFVTIVRRKAERYFRIAGVDPRAPGGAAVGDALVKAIAQEASDVASQFLTICIRAIDYCPPADMELGEYLRALVTADGDEERTDKWGFREALMRSFRRRHIFPSHVQFMTEAAVRWQPCPADLTIPGLAFRDLRFDGEPGRPADARELTRQAHALGRFVTDPRHAHTFKLVAPGAALPKGVVQASPPLVQSVRVTRRAAPDGRIQFDLIGEVTQSCTVNQGGEMFDMTGGCTVVIDPEGAVRYAIYKRFDSDARRARQHAAMHGPLKDFWRRERRRLVPVPDVLWRLHGAAAPRRRARER